MLCLLRPFILALPAVLLADTALAQLLATDDATVRAQLCVGRSCPDNPTSGFVDSSGSSLMLRGGRTRIDFQDSSVPSGDFPSNDWSLLANDGGQFGQNYFGILDRTGDGIPFRVFAGAGPNSLVVTDNGSIGIGTAIAQTTVHIIDNVPQIRLDHTSTQGTATYDLFANVDSLGIRNRNLPSSIPFAMFADAEDDAIVIRGSRVGLGTPDPQEKLHILTQAASTPAFALFEAAGNGSDAAFRLQQATTNTTWEFRNQASSGRLNVGIAGGNTPFKIDDLANNNLMRLGLNGAPNVVSVTGELRVNNTALNVPDYVFSDDYALRPLSQVETFIAQHNHLPDVPSAAQIAQDGIGVTDMQMALLKKVEELTLYTLQQENIIRAQAAKDAAQEARIARLEALLADG